MLHLPFDPIRLAIPVFVAIILVEIALAKMGRAKAYYEGRDSFTSLIMGLGNTVATVAMTGVIVGAMFWLHHRRVFDISMGAWWAWVAIFFLDDFIFYWVHRLSHERRFWWAAHVNHHSSQHFNLATALRQPWTGLIAGTWVPWLSLAWLGFPPEMIVVQNGISLVYQSWIHTEAIRRMPAWFEAVMNTPAHHRVHHAVNPRYLDKNYAGILIVWDRMFGTYEPERDDEPCRYGIVKNLGGFNILRVAFHEWMGIGQDLLKARSLRDVWGYVFGAPGWSPDGSRLTSEMIKERWLAQQAAAAPAAMAAE